MSAYSPEMENKSDQKSSFNLQLLNLFRNASLETQVINQIKN